MKKTHKITGEEEFLLKRECSLAALSIGQGLTLIRKYDFVKHGYANQAFFMLSIGLERLLKIILIYDFRIKNSGRFPDNGVLKKAGHNIRSLFQSAVDIAKNTGNYDLYAPLEADGIFDQIIGFLTEFAQSSRYYNLDILTGKSNDTGEPLRTWDSVINKIIVERHYKYNEKKAETISNIVSPMEDIILVSFNDEKGRSVGNLKDFYLNGMTVDVKQKYSMFYTYCIVRFLSQLLWRIDGKYSPMASEYFNIFRVENNAYVKRLKTWDIYKY
jgi:hypothetical protein